MTTNNTKILKNLSLIYTKHPPPQLPLHNSDYSTGYSSDFKLRLYIL